MLGASLENTSEDSVTVFVMMEEDVQTIARTNGFHFTLAENVSPLTQVIHFRICQI